MPGLHCPSFRSGPKCRARDKILANLCYGDALAEAEEIGFSIAGSFEDRLEQALSEMAQYHIDAEPESLEVVEEEIVYDFEDFPDLEDDQRDG